MLALSPPAPVWSPLFIWVLSEYLRLEAGQEKVSVLGYPTWFALTLFNFLKNTLSHTLLSLDPAFIYFQTHIDVFLSAR